MCFGLFASWGEVLFYRRIIQWHHFVGNSLGYLWFDFLLGEHFLYSGDHLKISSSGIVTVTKCYYTLVIDGAILEYSTCEYSTMILQHNTQLLFSPPPPP